MANEPTAAAGQEPTGEPTGTPSEPERKYTDEQFQALFADRLNRERKRLKKELGTELRAELLADEAFRTEALKEWDVKPGENKLDDTKVQDLFKTWESKHLVPVKEENESLRKKTETMQVAGLEADLLSAGADLVKKGLLKRRPSGHSALFEMLRSDLVRDPDTDEWRVRWKDGQYRPSSGGEHTYMTPAEYLREVWAVDEDNKEFIVDHTQPGSGYKGGPRDGTKRTYSAEEYRRLLNDPAYYEQHRNELLAAQSEGRVRG